MSYCRMDDTSDVYVFYSCSDYYECCGCSKFGNNWFRTPGEMVAHLEAHRADGDKVPQSAIDALTEEAP